MSNPQIRSIKPEMWQQGDYRPIAVINRPIDTVLKGGETEWFFHWREGLGNAKYAYFLDGERQQFCLMGYLDAGFPLTEVLVLHTDQEEMLGQLATVLEFLKLDSSDVDYIYNYEDH